MPAIQGLAAIAREQRQRRGELRLVGAAHDRAQDRRAHPSALELGQDEELRHLDGRSVIAQLQRADGPAVERNEREAPLDPFLQVEFPLVRLVPAEDARYERALGGLLHLEAELVVLVGGRPKSDGPELRQAGDVPTHHGNSPSSNTCPVPSLILPTVQQSWPSPWK